MDRLPLPELLSVGQMGQADRAAMAAGVPFASLMDSAGAAVAAAIQARWAARPVSVLCGPGNNGGDGLVVARLLAQAGWPVRLALAVAPERLSAPLKAQAAQWHGGFEPLGPAVLEGARLVVDALFGAGLNRPLDAEVKHLLARVAALSIPVVAVDVPSGVDGDTGQGPGAITSDLTVTFFRRKPGHILEPGRALCGELVLADIGIPAAVLDTLPVDTWLNERLGNPAAGAIPTVAERLSWRMLPAWPTAAAHGSSSALAAARCAAHALGVLVLQPAATPVLAEPDGRAVLHPCALPVVPPAVLQAKVEAALATVDANLPPIVRLAQSLWRLPAPAPVVS